VKEHFYSSTWMDRAEERRGDADWLAAQLRDARTRVVPVWRQRSLVQIGDGVRPVEIAVHTFAPRPPAESWFFLGIDGDGRSCFALDLPAEHEAPLPFAVEGEFTELRKVSARLEDHHAGLLAYARALAYWHATHRFCGACGSATFAERAGWLRVCGNDDCRRDHFPRTDPAVIVRVVHGDRVLLGRQAAWPAGWYSVLAGFVEPGESLEETVRREVAEEAGIDVTDVRYDSSQPWPFPASLMIGFSAVASNDHIRLASTELEDARWFTRQEINDEVAAGTLRLSPRQSISRHLLDVWLEQRGG
jgi:NAD+ diphosphatase